MSYVVILKTGPTSIYAYGPIDDPDHAREFAAFITREVDPAEMVKLINPIDEIVAWTSRQQSEPRPVGWPPQPGDIWQDRDGARWAATRVTAKGAPYLTCLARTADDAAEEIWNLHGPMTRVNFVPPTEQEEPPF